MPPVRLTVVQPADVRGRFHRARHLVFWLLIALWAALPWIPIGGHPAVFLDVAARRFFLFGSSFNAQDTWLLFFILTGVGFGLVFLTALAGRAWCGWSCPQTVFLEGVFRPIQRLVEGPREKRIRRDAAPWNAEKIARKVVVQALYAVVALLIAHVVLSYFVSIPRVVEMLGRGPAAHPEAFALTASVSGLVYFNFARFRERLCTSFCPYGRLQGVLVDDDFMVVGYDQRRGEPRGKRAAAGAGDCVDCKRCVTVCPTGIDIRDGLQLECVACAACIDACDEVMDRLHRPRGLVRYDSTRGLSGLAKRVWRPRVALYLVLLVAGVVVASFAAASRTDFEAALLRAKGAPFVVDGDQLRNSFALHLVNKRSTRERFHISFDGLPGAEGSIATPDLDLDGLAGTTVLVDVRVRRASFHDGFRFRLRVERVGADDGRDVAATFLGARP